MGLIFDSQEADAVGHMHDDIMIYSNSWGPPDTGYTFDSPGPLLTATLEIGAEKVNKMNTKSELRVAV